MLVWLLAVQVQAGSAASAEPAGRLHDAPAAGLSGDAPEPGTLLHPLRIELDRLEPGWRIARLEVRLDGALIARREEHQIWSPAGERADAWSGALASGGHEITVVLILHAPPEKQGDEPPPPEVRVERASRFRAGPSEAVALLIQAPPGPGDAPQIQLSRR